VIGELIYKRRIKNARGMLTAIREACDLVEAELDAADAERKAGAT
jgi:hypothetical protein